MPAIEQQQQVTVIVLDAEYDSLDEPSVERCAATLLDQAAKITPPLLVLDFGNTKFLGSRFIEVVVRVWKRICERQGQMVLCNLDPFCAEVLERTNLNRLWKFYPTRKSAVESLST
ncbi:MAG: STAS domain-containing protein [Pirellulales bacterium]